MCLRPHRRRLPLERREVEMFFSQTVQDRFVKLHPRMRFETIHILPRPDAQFRGDTAYSKEPPENERLF
jgi:hypothetical protein